MNKPSRVTFALAVSVVGVIMIVMGVAVMTGQLSTFSYWLLQAFPVLAKIG